MQHRGRKNQFDLMPVGPDPAPVRAQRPEPAPDHLSPTMQTWWAVVLAELELEPHRLHLLRLACEAYDRAQQARCVLATEGMTFTDKNGDPRARPECAIERDSRIAFARLVRELDLDAPVPQPPNEVGYLPPPVRPWRR